MPLRRANGDAVAETRIAGNEIARARIRAADEVAAGTAPDSNPEAVVAEGVGAGDVGADEIAEHGIAARAGIGNVDAILPVAGNDIARAGTGAANQVVCRATEHADAGVCRCWRAPVCR